MILPLSGPADGTLKRGDIIGFGDHHKAKIVGTEELGDEMDYHVKLYND